MSPQPRAAFGVDMAAEGGYSFSMVEQMHPGWVGGSDVGMKVGPTARRSWVGADRRV